MDGDLVLAVAGPIALGAAWLIYHLADFDQIVEVRRLVRWASTTLLVIGLLVPPAATAAFAWVATQEQERLRTIVEPIVDYLVPTTTSTSTTVP